MKGLFPQYDNLAITNYGEAWKQALFVFDTNVLLNLYRYKVGTRDELLNVLEQLSNRIWIPHHVALEFQRNRLKVIAKQSKHFCEVRRTIEKAQSSLSADLEKLQLRKRHSLINPESLLLGFGKIIDDFLKELNQLQESQQKITEPDPLKIKIESLFDGKVGAPPADQNFINNLYTEAEKRFKLEIPPGYQDIKKDKDDLDEYVHGSIFYKRRYGDYLVWRQLLDYAKESRSETVIFVTDDGKEDWWQKIDLDGPKTIGPRPELREEAATFGQISSFLMYNPEGFLKYSKEFLKAEVSEETLKEVRDVSRTSTFGSTNFREFQDFALRSQHAVMEWLCSRFETVQENLTGFPDFVAEQDGKIFGFEVKVVPSPRRLMGPSREVFYRAYYELKENRFTELTIVWVVSSVADIDRVRHAIYRISKDEMPDNLRITIGVCEDNGVSDIVFTPYEEFPINEAQGFLQATLFDQS